MIKIPGNLGLLIVNFYDNSRSDEIINALKEETKYLRLKNKVVTKNNVELILEFKVKNKHNIECKLDKISFVNDYSIVNYDRENRI